MSGRESRALGAWGEEQAAGYLAKKGLSVTASNWSCRYGEIDLIAQDDVFICFVEVKLRRSAAYGSAAAYVDWRKQEKLRTAAQLYLAEHPTPLQPRFDVIEVYAPRGRETKAPEILHWENAF